ncbi:MAG: hypothetical protein JO000_08040 [Alphaproteobacteria bacterium]|nr:hypothetical protein [Alphaproteobacteria bacterium]
MYSHTILFQPARDLRARRQSLHTLERLRGGWRPDRATLTAARRAERWTINRPADVPVFQFVGYCCGAPGHTSFIVGTLLAIDPHDGWALLAGDSWVALGEPAAAQMIVDARAVRHRAEAWLRAP